MPKPGPESEISDCEYLRAIREIYGPAVGTSEVASELGVSRQTAEKHLKRLHESGYLNTRMVGQVRVWWLDDDGERFLTRNC